MNKMKVYMWITLLILSFLMCSCAQEDFFDTADTALILSPYGDWELQGAGDKSSNNLVELMPSNKTSYRLTLRNDKTFWATTAQSTIEGKVEIESNRPSIRFVVLESLIADEEKSGSPYLTYLSHVFQYKVNGDELRLYFNSETGKFLKYKRLSGG